MPRHTVEIAPFRIGQFLLTNAEWACFMAAGGYEDERWWDTDAGRAWQRGEGTAEGMWRINRYWWQRFRERPEILEQIIEEGRLSEKDGERWRRWVALDEEALEEELRAMWPGGRLTEPLHWRNVLLNRPTQPVVGISWHELRAYTRWLAAQTGLPFRLLTEVEWEAAARGREGRLYAYGDEFDVAKGNLLPTHVRRTTPVGVFPVGDTPEGVCDLTGNVDEWTSSACGIGVEYSDESPTIYRYLYVVDDGREDPDTGTDITRVCRGGSWASGPGWSRAATRLDVPPDVRAHFFGGRLACSPSPITPEL